jgi:very-short-patch-repair endonuclease
MRLEQVLREFDGAARREQLLAAGISLTEMYGAASAGAVAHPHRGVFALLGADGTVAIARAFRGQVACVSACARWGLPLLERDHRTHVAVPDQRSQSRRGVRPVGMAKVHRVHEDVSGTWADSFTAIDQSARCTSPIAQLALVDAALRKGQIEPGDVKHLRFGTRKRREWIAWHASTQADSILETISRAALAMAGYRLQPQARFDDVGRVDLLVNDLLVVEVDGGQHFTSVDAIANDRRRDRALQLDAVPVLRYVYSDIVPDPSAMVLDVARVTGQAPDYRWRGRLRWALARPRPTSAP